MRTHLHQAVRNRALKHLEHACVVGRVRGTVQEAGPVPGIAQAPMSVGGEVEALELALAFKAAVECVLKQRRKRGLSYAEVAETMAYLCANRRNPRHTRGRHAPEVAGSMDVTAYAPWRERFFIRCTGFSMLSGL